jgi:hypothetical protein
MIINALKQFYFKGGIWRGITVNIMIQYEKSFYALPKWKRLKSYF